MRQTPVFPRCGAIAVTRVLRLLPALATALALVALGLAGPARADNVVTPGNFTGYGFDQCLTPTQAKMDRWLDYSPFWAVGIYISGDSRGCRDQPNLTPEWVATQLAHGWRLLPITLGPQASCHPSFPRYGNDPTINPDPGSTGKYPLARKQGRAEAAKSVAAAQALGISAGSTLWYDLEGFDATRTHCRESALRFLSAWTVRLRELGYVSGVYSSAGSGIKMLDDARVDRPGLYAMPDRIWIARWDGLADTSTSYLRSDGWLPGGRMKQYQGGHNETWGGVTINIDRSWLDLGTGSAPGTETHCDGVPVDFTFYPRLDPTTTKTTKVAALQCLLKEAAAYSGAVDGVFTPKLEKAIAAWRVGHGRNARSTWSRLDWMSLLAQRGGHVLKVGSAGRGVRRLQRSLNAAGPARLPITGAYDAATTAAVRTWQQAVGVDVTGIVTTAQWQLLRDGVRGLSPS